MSHERRWAQRRKSVPCSTAPFTLRSLAFEWEGAKVSNRDRVSEQEREEGEKEVCHALDYNQCVFGTRPLVLVWRAPARLQLNL